MSGYAELSGGAGLGATGIRAFLEKPFSGSRLLEVVGDPAEPSLPTIGPGGRQRPEPPDSVA